MVGGLPPSGRPSGIRKQGLRTLDAMVSPPQSRPQPASPRPVRTPPPHVRRIRTIDFLAVITVNAVLILGMWVRHGGITLLGSAQANLTALGQLTALLGTYAALVQIVLMSRSPWLEQSIGMDRLAHWHRWLGFSCVTLICAHVVLSTAGYALGDGSSFFGEASTLVTTYPYVLMATVSTALLIMIAASSIRAARRRMKYETWHFLHLYTYLAIALAFGHELAVGYDFSNDSLAVGYWIALYVVVTACVLAFRVGHPLRLLMRHRMRVARVIPETRDTVSIYITGRHLAQLQTRAGQFFKWRFMTKDGWWKAHPFSLSAAPNDQYLRITVKNVGDGTGAIQNVRPGTAVIAEGPYGLFTAALRRTPRVLLVAGGVGVTPLRALLEELPGGKGALVLIYRTRRPEDVIFRNEIDQLVTSRRGVVHYIAGDVEDGTLVEEPLSAPSIRRLVPDIGQREVFVCGPLPMMDALRNSLNTLGIARSRIHYERFALL